MNCSVCGAIIPTGQTSCPMCGAVVQADAVANQQPTGNASVNQGGVQPGMQPQYQQGVQPGMQSQYQQGGMQPQYQQGGMQPGMQPQYQQGGMQPGMQPQYQQDGMQPQYQQPGYQQAGYQQQPAGGYYQPQSTGAQIYGAGMNGFVNSLKSDVMNIVKLVAAVLLFIAVFLPWASQYVYRGKQYYTLFNTGGFNIFIGVLLLLLSLVMIVWEIADYIPVLANVKATVKKVPFIELIVLGVVFIFIIIGTVHITYYYENGYSINMSDWGVIHRSVGVVFAFIAIVAAIVPKVLDIMGIHVGKK